MSGRQGPVRITDPLSDTPLAAVVPEGGVVIVDRRVAVRPSQHLIRVVKVSARGDTVFETKIRYQPAKVPAYVSDSVRAALEGATIRVGVPANQVRSIRLPSHLPAVQTVVPGQDGSTWLKLWQVRGSPTWLVLDRRGKPQRRIQLPSNSELLSADSGLVWLSIGGAHSRQEVGRYVLERGVKDGER